MVPWHSAARIGEKMIVPRVQVATSKQVYYVCKDCSFKTPSSKLAVEHYTGKTKYHQLNIELE